MKAGINKEVVIHAPAAQIWKSMTDVDTMSKWMGDPAMALKVVTSWEIGSPIVITGFHHVQFENKGVVLDYLPDHTLSYNFLSSISRLPDSPESYSILRFILTPKADQTLLSLAITNFPTEAIYQHLNFYWNTTLVILKKMIEQ